MKRESMRENARAREGVVALTVAASDSAASAAKAARRGRSAAKCASARVGGERRAVCARLQQRPRVSPRAAPSVSECPVACRRLSPLLSLSLAVQGKASREVERARCFDPFVEHRLS